MPSETDKQGHSASGSERYRREDALLLECEVQTFRSSGPGGQNVNRRETAIRLRHLPTGIVVTCQDQRSQYQNKRAALAELQRRLRERSRRARPRVATKMSKGVKRRILANKRFRGERKRLRGRVRDDD